MGRDRGPKVRHTWFVRADTLEKARAVADQLDLSVNGWLNMLVTRELRRQEEVRQYRLALSQIRETIVCSHCGGEGHVKYGDPCQHCCGLGRVPRLSQEQMASVATRALTMDGGGS